MVTPKGGGIEINKNQTPHGSERLIMTETYLWFQLFDDNIFVEKEWKNWSQLHHIATMPTSHGIATDQNYPSAFHLRELDYTEWSSTCSLHSLKTGCALSRCSRNTTVAPAILISTVLLDLNCSWCSIPLYVTALSFTQSGTFCQSTEWRCLDHLCDCQFISSTVAVGIQERSSFQWVKSSWKQPSMHMWSYSMCKSEGPVTHWAED